MKPLILVSNDDGVLSPGIDALVEAVSELGDVIVCAPDTERSGSSHAITFHSHLRAHPLRDGWWRVSGTPVDCVYLALHHLCERRPALVVSGINTGYNLGTDVFYSGTVGAAAEGRLRGVSAIAASCDYKVSPRWAIPVVRRLAAAVLESPGVHLLNVNVPCPVGKETATAEEIDSLAPHAQLDVTRLGARVYQDSVDHRTDPMGRPYYWIGGPATRGHDGEGDDTYAIAQGRVSVTPLELDVTARDLDPTRQLLRTIAES